MADTILRVLAQGVLSNALKPLYVVSPNQAAEVHQIIMVNKDSAQRTVNIYLSARGVDDEPGPPRLITPSGLLMDAGDLTYVLDNPLQLSDGDQFFGVADVTGVVDYTMTGREQVQANEILQS